MYSRLTCLLPCSTERHFSIAEIVLSLISTGNSFLACATAASGLSFPLGDICNERTAYDQYTSKGTGYLLSSWRPLRWSRTLIAVARIQPSLIATLTLILYFLLAVSPVCTLWNWTDHSNVIYFHLWAFLNPYSCILLLALVW